jgi:hypothetical protein
MSWGPFEGGVTLGRGGSEDGSILRDEEHEQGARITLERAGKTAPFAITCGIYGWFFHTRFFGSEGEAATEFVRMQEGLAAVLALIQRANDPKAGVQASQVADAIGSFISQFP